jgi:hypothetical protein
MQREFNRIISITIGYYNEHDLENQINRPGGWAYKNPIFASQPRLSQGIRAGLPSPGGQDTRIMIHQRCSWLDLTLA